MTWIPWRIHGAAQKMVCHGSHQQKKQLNVSIFLPAPWIRHGMIWVCLKMSCTPCTPLYPMVLLIIIPFLNGYIIGKINPTFSDKPIYLTNFQSTNFQSPPSMRFSFRDYDTTKIPWLWFHRLTQHFQTNPYEWYDMNGIFSWTIGMSFWCPPGDNSPVGADGEDPWSRRGFHYFEIGLNKNCIAME